MFSVDYNDMGDINGNDSYDSQSMEEACIDDKNLFNPVVIQIAIADQLMAWDEIEKQTFECYYDYIMCELDPNSPSWEEDIQSIQMNEDVPDNAEMLSSNIYEDSNIITAMMTLCYLTCDKNMKCC